MPAVFIPGVRQTWGGTYGWTLGGGPKKMILHSTESDSAPGCVDQLCRYLDGWANPTFVWDPWTGDMAMCGRADMGGGALVTGNNDGSVVIQVEAVGRAGEDGKRPFTDSPMIGWRDKILPWLDSWGIPHVFPAGPAPKSPDAYGANNGHRPVDVWWNQSGYYCHSQVPGNDHSDPGVVDLSKLWPNTPPPKPVPLDIKIRMSELVLHCPVADLRGIWTADADRRAFGIRDLRVPSARKDPAKVKLGQQVMAFTPENTDSEWGPMTEQAWTSTVEKLQTAWGTTVDGDWGDITDFCFRVVRNTMSAADKKKAKVLK